MSRKIEKTSEYNKFQRFTSFFILFFFMFNITVHVPISFFGSTFADNKKFYDLVAILVSETVYDDIEAKVKRYGQDIQGVLPDTKALIIPTPDDVETFEVASLLEGLYFEGHKNLDEDIEYESRLVGTVLVGDIPLPVVHSEDEFANTILPYTDFKDKLYVYSHSQEKYIRSDKNRDGISAEIWHGVIAPNGNLTDPEGNTLTQEQRYDQKIDELEQYFDKNHDFYRGQGLFETSKGVLSGNPNDSLPEEYEPYIFYYNQFVEQQSINKEKFRAYTAWLENREDIAYNRFSIKLANRIDEIVNKAQDEELKELFDKVAPSFNGSFEGEKELPGGSGALTPDTGVVQSDIQAMQLILGTIKKYIETFSGPTLADINNSGLYSGRYGENEQEIRVDTLPKLVTLMDEVSVNTIQSTNNEIEEYIDDNIEGEWGLKTVVPLTYKLVESRYSGSENREEDQQVETASGATDDRGPLISACNSKVYTHFSYGRKGSDIETTEQCSIYPGSTWNFREDSEDGYNFAGQTVEANRGRNVLLTSEDLELCAEEISANSAGVTGGVTGYWGGNTPINLLGATGEDGELKLGAHDVAKSITPLFDIIGAKKVETDEIDYRANLAFSRPGNPEIMDSTTSALNTNRFSTCSLYNYIQTYGFNEEEQNSKPILSDDDEYGGECNQLVAEELTDVTKSEVFSCDMQHEVTTTFNGQPLPLAGSCYLFDPGECGVTICRFWDGEPYYDSSADPGEPGHCDDLVQGGAKPAGACNIYNERKNDICLDDIKGGKITSHIFSFGGTQNKAKTYKSPTSAELSTQSKSQFAPSLPIDAERYVEFFARGEFNLRFFYPNYFRAADKYLESGKLAATREYINNSTLKVYNEEMNEHINGQLSQMKPAGEIDVQSLFIEGGDLFESRPIESFGELKGVNKYITILNSLYYYQLANTSNRYRYIFENYLYDQYDGKNINRDEIRRDTAEFYSPENKKLYEIVYLNAPGDIANMHIKMSPEEKDTNPYEQEILKIAEQRSNLLTKNLSGGQQIEQNSSSCTPPAGVDLNDFIPALGCELDKLSPENISQINDDIRQNLIQPESTPEPEETLSITPRLVSLAEQQTISINSQDSVVASDGINIFLFDESSVESSEISTLVSNHNTTNEKLLLGMNGYDNFEYFDILYPISIQLQRGDSVIYQGEYDRSNINSYIPVTSLNDAGEYILKIIDANGEVGKQKIYVNSDTISNAQINLGSNILEQNGTQTQNYVSLEDVYGNRISGDLYKIDIEIDGESIELVDEISGNKATTEVFDGSYDFTLKSTSVSGTSEIKATVFDREGSQVVETSKTISVVSEISISDQAGIEIQDAPEIFVGDNSYDLELQMLNENGEIFSDFNGISRVSLHELYGDVKGWLLPRDEQGDIVGDRSYTNLEQAESANIEFVNGLGKITLTTRQSSSESVALQFQTPGLGGIDEIRIDILPEQIALVDMTLSKTNISTVNGDSAIATVELKDQFGNVVTTDNSTVLTLEIPSIFGRTIYSDELEKQVKNGVAQFRISSRGTSQTAYFKVSANTIGDDITITGQAPFQKQLLDDITGMRSGTPKILSLLGKRFFTEAGPESYISIFPKKQYLLESEAFNSVPSSLQNEIEALWDDNNTYTIDSLDYAIGKVNTMYFWIQDTFKHDEEAKPGDKREPETRRYNGLYSVLLGSPYGDYTTPDYLAGELLFDDTNRSLAVTSVLNNPYEKNDVFEIKSSGGLSAVEKSSNLFQDTQFHPHINSDGKLEVSIYNNSLHIYIGKVVYNLSDINTLSCPSEIEDIVDCLDNEDVSQLVLQSLSDDTLTYASDDSVVLKQLSGPKILEIDSEGIWENDQNISIEIDQDNLDAALRINILANGNIIAKAILQLSESSLNISRNKQLFEQKLETLQNTILLHIESSRYSHRIADQGNYSQLRLSYNDEFQSSTNLDEFHSESEHGFENSLEYENIGWEGNNKSLLSFSAGKRVGESNKEYMSFSTINLGDPVIGVGENFLSNDSGDEEVEVVRGFDTSIGEILAKKDDLEAYQVFDYNKDGYKDILLIESTGKMSLLQNRGSSGKFRERGILVAPLDISDPKQVFTGDFTGDGYEDIFFINNKSKPVLLNNYKTTFHRYDLDQDLELEETSVILSRVFDMDDDSISDIITLQSDGELNIYYGSDIEQDQDIQDAMLYPEFTKKNLDTGIGLTLDEQTRSDGGVIYFDGLYQPEKLGTDTSVYDTTSEEILDRFNQNAQILSQPGGRTPQGEGIGEEADLTDTVSSLIEPIIFQQISYDPNNNGGDISVQDQIGNSIRNNAGESSDASLQRSIDALGDIDEQFGENISYSEDIVSTSQTNFIHSGYASYVGVSVEKKFSPSSSGSTFTSGSSLDAEIIIRNDKNTRLSNVVYMESVDNLLNLDTSSIITSREDINIKRGASGYDFVLDGFDLAPGEELTINYSAALFPVTFGHMEVGYFEEDTLGNDPYGDVILKSSHENCGGAYGLYASISEREYQRQTDSPSCDPEKNQIPDFLLNNLIDEYGYVQVGVEDGKPVFEKINEPNGVPDYIDDMQLEISETDPVELLPNSCLLPDGGGVATDAPEGFPTDLSEIIWHGANVSEWEQTAELGPISISGDFINLPYDKTGEWPVGYPLGPTTKLVANAWIFYEENGKWHADTFEWMRPGQTAKFAAAVAGGGHIRSRPEGWAPSFGNTYGFMVSGFARINARPNIKERSNISFFDCGEGSLLSLITQDSDGDGVPDLSDTNPKYNNETSTIDEFNESVETISDEIDERIYNMCNVGGSWPMPINWAPLAPGNELPIFGQPGQDGLNVDEGYPIFSALTGMLTNFGCIPMVHPVSSLATSCSGTSAGGMLGTWDAGNVFRIFVTPTLTGSAGVAFCFGGPASTYGNLNSIGTHPLVAGGNCIVAAKRLFDDSDDVYTLGDPESTGPSYWSPQPVNNNNESGGNNNEDAPVQFGIIHGNCSAQQEIQDTQLQNDFTPEYVQNYLNFRQSSGTFDILPPTLQEQTRETFDRKNIYGQSSVDRSSPFTRLDRPLISAGPQSSGADDIDLSVSLDISKAGDAKLGEVVKIQNKRIAAFPDFLMDWVARQIEEIVTKLTDFPTFYVILPSFDHLVNDDWGEFRDALSKGDAQGEETSADENQESSSQSQISGMKEAYEFLSNVPFINIEEEVVNIDVPWPGEDLQGVITQWQLAKDQWQQVHDQWKQEIEQAGSEWTREDIDFINLEVERFILSLDKNVEILESYGDIPEEISEVLSIKQVWIEQLIGSVEQISEMMGGWINRNGETFKQWVETYMLIKTILKSWQLIIDIFNDYQAECYDCKNERYDLQYFIWKLISIVIPDIPVIIFPKWPDVVLDLHNIRTGIDIVLPDFNFNPRPLILPRIPVLVLPDRPNVNIEIPNIPLLPELEIQDLPRLPDIPNIDLPNLPQAPQIPKILASFEGILNILKLVVKAMCILKQSPFVPEWRAGDQIAFITERQGFLPIDFIDVRLPQYSFPFVDAIKTTSYVNLEYDADFIIEASRGLSSVMRVFSNDVINKLRINNVSNTVGVDIPDDVDVNVDVQGEIDLSTQNMNTLLSYITNGIANLVILLNEQKDNTVSATDFITEANISLAQVLPGEHDKIDEIKRDFETLATYTFAREDEFIKKLEEQNKDKFDTLSEILRNESDQNTQTLKNIEILLQNNTFTQISSDSDNYDGAFDKYNASFIKSATDLIVGENKIADEFQAKGKNIIAQVQEGTQRYSKKIYALENATPGEEINTCEHPEFKNIPKPQYEGIFISEQTEAINLTYRLFNYLEELKGDEQIIRVDIDNDEDEDILYLADNHLYIKYNYTNTPNREYVTDRPEEINIRDNKYFNEDIFYEAIDHFEEEVIASNTSSITFDAHAHPDIANYRVELSTFVSPPLSDDDLLLADLDKEVAQGYVRNKQIIDVITDIENVSTQNTQPQDETTSIGYTVSNNIATLEYVGNIRDAVLTAPRLVNINDDIDENNIVNIAPDTKLYSGKSAVTIRYVDTQDNVDSLFIPARSHVVFEDNIRIFAVNNDVFVASNSSKKIDVKQQLLEQEGVEIPAFTKIYAEDTLVEFEYRDSSGEDQAQAIRPFGNIELSENIIVTAVDNNMYTLLEENITLEGQDIREYLHLPLLDGAQIVFNDTASRLTSTSRIEIEYYDESNLVLDAESISSYRLIHEEGIGDEIEIRINQPNGYYYGQVSAWNGEVTSTKVGDVILAPQLEADVFEPELDYRDSISLALGQTLRVDLSEFILEDSGIDNIEQIIIDTDVNIDSDSDGFPETDKDVTLDNYQQDRFINIIQTNEKIALEFGPYRQPIETSINVTLIDQIGNIGSQQIELQVYAPTPEIISYQNQTFSGSINEQIEDIPISIYRYRQGGLDRIRLGQNTPYTGTDVEGNYTASGSWTGSGLTLYSSGFTLARIDEYTGSSDVSDVAITDYRLELENKYPKIILQNGGSDAYYYYPLMGENNTLSLVQNFENIIDQGMYMRLTNSNSYSYYQIPTTARFNPGAVVVYRATSTLKEPLFTLYPDGRIDTLGDFYDVAYKNSNDGITLELIDQNFDRVVAEIYYKLGDGYILDTQFSKYGITESEK